MYKCVMKAGGIRLSFTIKVQPNGAAVGHSKCLSNGTLIALAEGTWTWSGQGWFLCVGFTNGESDGPSRCNLGFSMRVVCTDWWLCIGTAKIMTMCKKDNMDSGAE